MRIALIAPPFIPVPPVRYGGTELFIGQLAKGLKERGVDVVVYTNGEATVPVERRWLYPQSEWPIQGEVYDNLKDLNHTSWAVHDAAADCDIIHVNNVPGVMFSRYVAQPTVYTMHHPHLEVLSAFFSYFPQVEYVTISDFQRHQEKVPHIRTIYHGLDFDRYRCCDGKEDYLAFIGRIAPVKGPHLAIQIAKRAGMRLKLAGEVQPLFRDYFEREIKPHLDGKNIEFVGEVDLEAKNDFLGRARALLFPIQWDEPFGLVMIEAMACGTPVVALSAGSVPEIVQGVGGVVCRSVEEMVDRVRDLKSDPAAVRAYAEDRFSIQRMVAEYHALYEELLQKRGRPAGEEGELPAGQAVA